MRNRLTASAAGSGLIASLTATIASALLMIAGMFVFAAPASAAPTGSLSYDGTDLRYHFVNDQGAFVRMTVTVDGLGVASVNVQPNSTADNRVDPSELEWLVCGDDYTAVLTTDVVQGPLDTLVFTACEKPGSTESPSPDTKAIEAKALTDHSCDSTEWHFVITQVASEEQAPAEIVVTWANGKTEKVVLEKFTGGVAHYTTTSNLTSTVTSATAGIYASWSGQFNLSHGPCKTSSPSPSPSESDDCTPTPTPTETTPTPTPTETTPTPTPTETTPTPTPTETTPTPTPTETTPEPTDTPTYGGDAGASSPASSGSRVPYIVVAMIIALMLAAFVWNKLSPASGRRH